MNNTLARWERYSPVGIGLEEMFKRLDTFADSTSSNYPPYNLVKIDDNSQKLELALAGHSREDIEVSVEKKVLNIKATRPIEEDQEYVHRGIAQRSFSRNWQLSDDTVVTDVAYTDGMLSVVMEQQVPEEQKRKVLPIS